MLGLVGTTLITSFIDSFNPIGITQQFVLQGLVKKPKHIWYFIIPTGVTNFIAGFLAYYGLVALIREFFDSLFLCFGTYLYIAECILGILFFIIVSHLIQNQKIKRLERELHQLSKQDHENCEEEEARKKIKSVAPGALILFGIGATIAELTSALPYFAFLAVLLQFELSLLEVTVLLLIYNIIYMSPLMVLYFVYRKAQDKFDRFYTFIKKYLTKWSNVLMPAFTGVLGLILVFHSLYNLFAPSILN